MKPKNYFTNVPVHEGEESEIRIDKVSLSRGAVETILIEQLAQNNISFPLLNPRNNEFGKAHPWISTLHDGCRTFYHYRDFSGSNTSIYLEVKSKVSLERGSAVVESPPVREEISLYEYGCVHNPCELLAFGYEINNEGGLEAYFRPHELFWREGGVQWDFPDREFDKKHFLNGSKFFQTLSKIDFFGISLTMPVQNAEVINNWDSYVPPKPQNRIECSMDEIVKETTKLIDAYVVSQRK